MQWAGYISCSNKHIVLLFSFNLPRRMPFSKVISITYNSWNGSSVCPPLFYTHSLRPTFHLAWLYVAIFKKMSQVEPKTLLRNKCTKVRGKKYNRGILQSLFPCRISLHNVPNKNLKSFYILKHKEHVWLVH